MPIRGDLCPVDDNACEGIQECYTQDVAEGITVLSRGQKEDNLMGVGWFFPALELSVDI